MEDWVADPVRRALAAQRTLIERFSADGARVFFERDQFPWASAVEREWRAIREELDRLLEVRNRIPAFHQVSPRQQGISDERWKTVFFHVYGNAVPEALQLCPQTGHALAGIPGLRTAMFSILGAGKVIPPHRGPLKGVLRFHLGLRIPQGPGECAIRVNGEARTWRDGEALIFDDTFEHEAWNLTGEDRVVLFADFVRPLPRALAVINRAVLGGLKHMAGDVKEAHRNARRYATELAAATASTPRASSSG
jgi:ornithine lipid ester-linked acyl 2-hydroxylase